MGAQSTASLEMASKVEWQTLSQYVSQKGRECLVARDHREFAVCQTSTMVAPRVGGPSRGEEVWQMVRAGLAGEGRYESWRHGYVGKRSLQHGEAGCKLVTDQRLIEELVDTVGSWIEDQDLAVVGLIDIAEGQPLRLIRPILHAAQNPDRDFLLQAAS